MKLLNTYFPAALIGSMLAAALIVGLPQNATAAPMLKPASAGNMTLSGHHPNESWATPTLAGTHLTPQTPLVAEKDDKPTFTRELVSVGWRPFDTINLYVIKPKVKPAGAAKDQQDGKLPVVLYLYDYTNNTKRFLNDAYCERITRSGCAAVGFESALSADRFQMRPMSQWFVGELPESLAESAHDVQMVLNYLGTRGDLDTAQVGMFGQGSGASIAVLAAGADPRIKALELLNPWGDWPVWLNASPLIPAAARPRLTQAAFTKSVRPLDPAAWLPRLKGRAIRLIQVKDDFATPSACQAALAKALPVGAQVVAYDNNLALLGGMGQGRLFAWLGHTVKTAGQ